MARPTSSKKPSSTSNASYKMTSEARTSVRASCYTVDARTAALSGFHYSSTGARGAQCPPVGATVEDDARRRFVAAGAAYTITEECERLFCKILRAVFLGEREAIMQDSLVMGAHFDFDVGGGHGDGGLYGTTPPAGGNMFSGKVRRPTISRFVEVFDYAGGARFRGFTADHPGGDAALFVFFDTAVLGNDLKQGLMALIELASMASFGCDRVVICLDRDIPATEAKALMRDLGWVGFELTKLDDWAQGQDVTSDRWLFLGMEL